MWDLKFLQDFVRCGALTLHSSGLQDSPLSFLGHAVKRDRQRLDVNVESYPWLLRSFLVPLKEGVLEHEGLRTELKFQIFVWENDVRFVGVFHITGQYLVP